MVVLAAGEHFRNPHERAGEKQHQRRKREHRRKILRMLDHRRNVGRERIGAGAVDKRGDDHVVDRKRKREQSASDDAGHQNRQLNLEERVPGTRPEIIRRFNDAVVEILESGKHGHRHVRDAERHVSDENRPESAIDVDGDEKHQQRNADEDIGHHQRRIDQRMVNRLQPVLPAVERERRRRAENAGDYGRQTGDGQRQPETLQQRSDRIMSGKELFIPFERKTGARGLRSIMENVMMDVMYNIPSDDTIAKCIITKEAVEGTGEPVLEYRTDDVVAIDDKKKKRVSRLAE